MIIRVMTVEDYDKVYELWSKIQGFGIRTIDDSREGIEKFIRRNPTTSIVAEENGRMIGTILCGHDGRRGNFYHVCVAQDYRKKGIGQSMAIMAINALKAEGINTVSLVAFRKNTEGNTFWKKTGWIFR